MTSRLATIYALDEALANELMALDERLEERAATRAPRAIPEPPAPPKGMKPLIAHQRRPELVYDDPLIIRSAFSRDLFWRYYLAHIRPTPESAAKAASRLQGWALYHLARKRVLAGQELPLKSPTTHVPAYALAPLPGRATNQRCMLPDATRDDATSAGDWWEQYGNVWSLNMARDEWATIVSEFGLPEFEDVGRIWDFEQLLNLQNYYDLTDLDVLQALDAAWAESVFASAAAGTLSEAGIEGGLEDLAGGVVGTFDIVDPYVLDFLRNQSGYLIAGIDETTRGFVSETLWTFLGGASDVFQPQNVDSVARLLRQFASQWDNDLANMSRYRAFLISVTETARAESFGSFVAMWQTGALTKYWMITSGACLRCITNAEAGNIPILQEFPMGGLAPPGHPKCRCSLSAYVPQQFNPNEWIPRDTAPFDEMLFSNAGGVWPNIDLSSLLMNAEIDLDAADLGGLGRAATPEQTREGALKRDEASATRSPLDVNAAKRQAALGRAFMDAADAAMVVWAREAGIRIPTHLEQWKVIAQALKSPTERHTAADARYAEALLVGLADAAKRHLAR